MRFFSCLTLFFLLANLFISCKSDQETTTPKSNKKEITSLPTVTGITGASSVFDASSSTYTITVPFGTDIKAIKLTLPVSAGAKIDPEPTVARDYTNPVIYTVTAEDNTTQKYTVKVVTQVAPKSSEKQITAFTFAALIPVVSATIDQSTRKLGATVPSTADLTKLVPTITLSSKSTVSPASGVAQNFTNPVSYTVTAEDGSTQTYEVKVEKVTVITSNVPCLLTRIEDAVRSSRKACRSKIEDRTFLRSSRKACRSKIEDRTFICLFFLPLSNFIRG